MLKHKGTQIIETERLILRPFTMADAEAMYRSWASDDEVTKYLTWPTHESVEVTKAVLADWTSGYEKPGFYNWAIVLKENGPEPIGNIAVVSAKDKFRLAHIGYALGRTWWNRGIMTEAFHAVIDFLFDQVNYYRIESRHDVENAGSGAVMRKCGLQYEGRMRKAAYTNLGFRDMDCYAILSTDR